MRPPTSPLEGGKHVGPSMRTASVQAKAGPSKMIITHNPTWSLLSLSQTISKEPVRVCNPVFTHHHAHPTLMNRRCSRLQIRVTQSPRTRTEISAANSAPIFCDLRDGYTTSASTRILSLRSACRHKRPHTHAGTHSKTGVGPLSAYI